MHTMDDIVRLHACTAVQNMTITLYRIRKRTTIIVVDCKHDMTASLQGQDLVTQDSLLHVGWLLLPHVPGLGSNLPAGQTLQRLQLLALR